MSKLQDYIDIRTSRFERPFLEYINAADAAIAELRDEIADLKRTIESRKVCGNCNHGDIGDDNGWILCGEFWKKGSAEVDADSMMYPWDHCQFSPSHWEEHHD